MLEELLRSAKSQASLLESPRLGSLLVGTPPSSLQVEGLALVELVALQLLLQSALELHARFRAGGQRVCAGITTGNLLCTCVGAQRVRLEYTVSVAFRTWGMQGFGVLVPQSFSRYSSMP